MFKCYWYLIIYNILYVLFIFLSFYFIEGTKSSHIYKPEWTLPHELVWLNKNHANQMFSLYTELCFIKNVASDHVS